MWTELEVAFIGEGYERIKKEWCFEDSFVQVLKNRIIIEAYLLLIDENPSILII